MPVAEAPEVQTANRRSTPWHWVVLGLLVIAHGILGVYFTPIGANVEEQNSLIGGVMMGVLGSQPILFAIWAAFAPQRFYHRFFWSLLLCTLVSFAEELGTLRHSGVRLGFTMVSELTLFMVATGILLLVRRLTRWQMKQSIESNLATDYQAYQFGIKHLIILTTIVAVVLGLFRTLLTFNGNITLFPSVAQFISFASLIVALLYPVIVIPWCTLAYRGKIFYLLLFAIITWAILDLPLILVVESQIWEGAMTGEIIEGTLVLQLGAGLSAIVTTLVIRLCGFRLVRMPKGA